MHQTLSLGLYKRRNERLQKKIFFLQPQRGLYIRHYSSAGGLSTHVSRARTSCWDTIIYLWSESEFRVHRILWVLCLHQKTDWLTEVYSCSTEALHWTWNTKKAQRVQDLYQDWIKDQKTFFKTGYIIAGVFHSVETEVGAKVSDTVFEILRRGCVLDQG